MNDNEQCNCTRQAEFDKLKEGIAEIKSNEKEIEHLKEDMMERKSVEREFRKDLTNIKESNIETKLLLKMIQSSQERMAMDAKANQEGMLKGIDDLKSEPIKNFKYYKMVGWAFAITYVLGTIFGIAKAFIK